MLTCVSVKVCILVEAQFSFVISCTGMCKYKRILLETFLKSFCFHLDCRWSPVDEQILRECYVYVYAHICCVNCNEMINHMGYCNLDVA